MKKHFISASRNALHLKSTSAYFQRMDIFKVHNSELKLEIVAVNGNAESSLIGCTLFYESIAWSDFRPQAQMKCEMYFSQNTFLRSFELEIDERRTCPTLVTLIPT